MKFLAHEIGKIIVNPELFDYSIKISCRLTKPAKYFVKELANNNC